MTIAKATAPPPQSSGPDSSSSSESSSSSSSESESESETETETADTPSARLDAAHGSTPAVADSIVPRNHAEPYACPGCKQYSAAQGWSEFASRVSAVASLKHHLKVCPDWRKLTGLRSEPSKPKRQSLRLKKELLATQTNQTGTVTTEGRPKRTRIARAAASPKYGDDTVTLDDTVILEDPNPSEFVENKFKLAEDIVPKGPATPYSCPLCTNYVRSSGWSCYKKRNSAVGSLKQHMARCYAKMYKEPGQPPSKNVNVNSGRERPQPELTPSKTVTWAKASLLVPLESHIPFQCPDCESYKSTGWAEYVYRRWAVSYLQQHLNRECPKTHNETTLKSDKSTPTKQVTTKPETSTKPVQPTQPSPEKPGSQRTEPEAPKQVTSPKQPETPTEPNTSKSPAQPKAIELAKPTEATTKPAAPGTAPAQPDSSKTPSNPPSCATPTDQCVSEENPSSLPTVRPHGNVSAEVSRPAHKRQRAL
ncbi:hypothetical protein Pelo_12055 [Pelomyxa schiedti]|nr:hypothetical protein Pelo_12055 [Pelomyxa schiedti]